MLIITALTLNNAFAITGMQVLQRSEEATQPKTSRAFVIMKVYSGYDSYRTIKMKSYSMGSELSYSEYVYPKNIEGMKYLSRGDNIWIYYPKTNRVRKLAKHMEKRPISGVGGDFAARDMKQTKWSEKYTAKILRSDKDKYVVEARGKTSGTYKKLVVHIKQSNFVPVKTDYYNEDGRKFKTLYMKNVEKIKGVWFAKKLIMKSYDRGAKTVIEMKSVSINIRIKRKYFSLSNLRR
jgi:outer membrane lipoprotein-sorting protein